MTFEVVFTKRSENDFDSILNYIQADFGSKSAEHFKDLIIEFAKILETFPEIGTLEVEDKGIRGSVIHKRLKVFYRVKNKRVIILRLFDTRQNPDKRF